MVSRQSLTRMPSKGQVGQRFSWSHLDRFWNHLDHGICEITFSLRPLIWSSLSHGRNDFTNRAQPHGFTNTFDPDAFGKPTGSTIFVKPLGPILKSFGAWPNWIHEHLWPGCLQKAHRVNDFREITWAVFEIIWSMAEMVSRTSLTRMPSKRPTGSTMFVK